MQVLFIEAPPGIRPEKKRVMMQKIDVVCLDNGLGDVAMDGRIQSENPKILEPLRK